MHKIYKRTDQIIRRRLKIKKIVYFRVFGDRMFDSGVLVEDVGVVRFYVAGRQRKARIERLADVEQLPIVQFAPFQSVFWYFSVEVAPIVI